MIREISPSIGRHLSREEYHELADMGLFEREKVELIGGEIFRMSPQNPPHATACALVERIFYRLENDSRYVRSQKPFYPGIDHEPEPDIALVSGKIRDHATRGPTSVLHVVEVADSSLRYDRTVKSQLYASEGVAEYWIVNLIDRVLEVYRQPNRASFESGDATFAEQIVLSSEEAISPLVDPTVQILVFDMLP